MAAEKPGSKGQAWFCTTGLPSDVVIEVDEMSFHLHKFPLMSKSNKLHELITEREQNARTRTEGIEGGGEEEEIEEEEEDLHHIPLPEFPGGAEIFETAAKFCYGVKIDITAWNAAPLRCAADYLEMTEEFSEENLISRTERFLAQSILRSLKESVRTLKSCEDLLPLAEDLGITQRCIDSIAARASSSDLSSLFGWPITEAAAAAGEPKTKRASSALWNGIDAAIRRKSGIRSSAAEAAADSWFEDLTVLSLPMYKRVIAAMRAHDLSSEVIEGSLISYAKRSIPGLSRTSRHHAPAPLASEPEQRELLETVISNLPQGKSSGLVTTRFLFGLLRTANILRASEACTTALERKIASQLEQAKLDDLLIPNYSYLVETLYDVDCVERILCYFLEGLQERSAIVAAEEDGGELAISPAGNNDNPLLMVGKLVDGYLSEIASDANLRPEKFCDLALALPDHARVFDDGLYRAVDVYLKAHPRITEEERERVSSVMACQKLTLEACTHAAQNERLPLRAVVQVLFFEQLQLRRAIAGTLAAAAAAGDEEEEGPPATVAAAEGGRREGDTWRTAIRENQVLRLDMDSMRSRVRELERECSTMKKAIGKMDRIRGAGGGGDRAGGWGSLTRRFGCKFTTQVCDSHQRTVVEPRKSRTERSP
ncbi:BTB/POZ domain-containing protein [Cocos nucifera]|uniref:BTB/POZ domain-containing protein n=1 Tax=Cocos nucifera TaxID=13894 RepID=A0A8K0N3V4_COCNU|nr:BTB/POZ domain-containing protein [Cocos nucifera]